MNIRNPFIDGIRGATGELYESKSDYKINKVMFHR